MRKRNFVNPSCVLCKYLLIFFKFNEKKEKVSVMKTLITAVSVVFSAGVLLQVVHFLHLQFWLGEGNPLSLYEITQCCVVFLSVVVAACRLYYLCADQVRNMPRNTFVVATEAFLDRFCAFNPHWVWIYSFVYYLIAFALVILISSLQDLILFLFRALVLMAVQCVVWLLWPSTLPESYIDLKKQHHQPSLTPKYNSLSFKFLRFIQKIDGQSVNTLPSAHCSFFTLSALSISHRIGYFWVCSMIIVVQFSCLFTKQHLFIDTLVGIAFGAILFAFT